MTRSEFIDNVTEFSELIDFCRDEGCDELEDVYSDDGMDEYIDEELVDMARNCDGWRSLLDTLSGITTGYDYYYRDEYGDWVGLGDSDFDDYKNDVLDWMDSNDYWDDEEDEDDEEEYFESDDSDYSSDDDEHVIEEPVPIDELFTACSAELKVIDNNKQAEMARDDSEFDSFIEETISVIVEE